MRFNARKFTSEVFLFGLDIFRKWAITGPFFFYTVNFRHWQNLAVDCSLEEESFFLKKRKFPSGFQLVFLIFADAWSITLFVFFVGLDLQVLGVGINRSID